VLLLQIVVPRATVVVMVVPEELVNSPFGDDECLRFRQTLDPPPSTSRYRSVALEVVGPGHFVLGADLKQRGPSVWKWHWHCDLDLWDDPYSLRVEIEPRRRVVVDFVVVVVVVEDVVVVVVAVDDVVDVVGLVGRVQRPGLVVRLVGQVVGQVGLVGIVVIDSVLDVVGLVDPRVEFVSVGFDLAR
jgi:hypothetical protein